MSLSFTIKKIIRLIVNFFQYDLNRIRNKNDILNYFKIDLVLDIGANIGQTRDELRKFGYKKKIISFEPLFKEHNILKVKSKKDPDWTIYDRCAIGEKNEKTNINVSKNSYSSSILDILPSHLHIAPNSKYIDQQEIDVINLDSIYNEVSKNSKNIFLKIDTQGYEYNVLKGLNKNLKNICLIQVELSLLPLYKNQELYDFLIEFFKKNNFDIWSIKEGIYNLINGRTNQIDVIFFNKDFNK